MKEKCRATKKEKVIVALHPSERIIDFDDDDVNEDSDGPGIIQDDISDDDELLPSLDDKDDG